MKSFTQLLFGALPLLTLAQEAVDYTDPATGITLNTWPQGPVTWGMALPPNALSTTPATEFIGLLTCTTPTAPSTGWCGLSLGGGMVEAPLLLAYPSPTAADPNRVLTSFRWASSYGPPTLYTGPAALSQISSSVNATHYSVLFRCTECLAWKQGDVTGQVSTAEGMLVLGWAHHAAASPTNGACADSARVGQHAQQGMFGAMFSEAAVNAKYQEWTGLAKGAVKGECGAAATTASVVTSVVGLPATTAVVGSLLPPGTSETPVTILPTSETPVIIRPTSETPVIIRPTSETAIVIRPTAETALPPVIATSVVQLPTSAAKPTTTAKATKPAHSKDDCESRTRPTRKPSVIIPTAPKPSIWIPSAPVSLPTRSPILTVPKPSIWIPTAPISLPTRSPILTVPKPSVYLPTTLIPRPSTVKTTAKASTTKVPTTLIPRPSKTRPVVVVPTRTPRLPPCRKEYKVVRGDYCWLIAYDAGMTLEKLYELNPDVECQPLQINEVVCLSRG